MVYFTLESHQNYAYILKKYGHSCFGDITVKIITNKIELKWLVKCVNDRLYKIFTKMVFSHLLKRKKCWKKESARISILKYNTQQRVIISQLFYMNVFTFHLKDTTPIHSALLCPIILADIIYNLYLESNYIKQNVFHFLAYEKRPHKNNRNK